MAKSADGTSRWSTFEQLRLRGYRYGPNHAQNNIYFWAVRVLPRRPHVLAAFFPAVVQGQYAAAKRSNPWAHTIGTLFSTSHSCAHARAPRAETMAMLLPA